MKKLLCLILAVVLLMGTLSITAFATEEDTSDDVSISELEQEMSRLYLEAYGRWHFVGEMKPYTDNTFLRLEHAMETVDNINYNTATKEEYENAISELKYALENSDIDTAYAKETYVLSLEEHNDNGFYDEADWNDFTEKRDALRDSFKNGDEKTISDAYFALYDSFTNMTNKYHYGDVNGDGTVDIDDATLVQRYIAHMTNFSSIQLELTYWFCAEYEYNSKGTVSHVSLPGISIDNVTAIQEAIINDDSLITQIMPYGDITTDSFGVEFNSIICMQQYDDREWVYEKVKELEAEGII